MKNTITLKEISPALKGELKGDATFEFVSIDSRTIKPGELFIALKGPNFDGHDFITAAKEKGAVAALISKPIAVEIPTLQVADTRLALGQLAKMKREHFPVPLIALTGSCGKTTLKEMIKNILSERGAVLASQGTLNNDYGVPLTLLKITSSDEFAVIEMGANHPGEIAYVTDIAQPQVAIINNIKSAHLEGFGSIEGVARAKTEIFQGLTKEGIAVINADDDFADFCREKAQDKKVFTFGKKNLADFSAHDLKPNADFCFHFILKTPKGEIAIQLPLPGEHQVSNALAAAAATFAIGTSLQTIKNGLEKMQPVPGRLMLRHGRAGVRIFDDSYNANPSSVAAALQVLAQCPGQRLFVMGDMRELGENEKNFHAEIGRLAKELGIQHFYAYGHLTRFAVEAFGEAGHYFALQSDLIKAVNDVLTPDMTVLVKGSLSMKMKDVVNALIEEKIK